MKPNQKYNGWENYPTWVTKLWMDSEPGSYNAMIKLAEETKATVKASNHLSAEDEQVLHFARVLEHEIKEYTQNTVTRTGLAADLIGFTLQQIDFVEIAYAYLEEIE